MSKDKYILVTKPSYKLRYLDGCRAPLIRNKYPFVVVGLANGYTVLARHIRKDDSRDVKRLARPLPEGSQILEYA